MPLTSTTIGNGILVELAAFLKRRGVSFDSLRAAAGLDRIDADDAKQVFALKAVILLFDHAARASQDPCLGLTFAREIRPGSSGLIGRIVLNAPSLRLAVEAAEKYFPTFVTDFHVFVRWDRDPVEVSWEFPVSVSGPRDQFNLFLVGSAVRWLRKAAGEGWHPPMLRLEGAEPPCRDLILAQLGPTTTFRSPANMISIEASELDRPMPNGDPQLFGFLVELAEKWLREGVNLPGIVGSVRGQLVSRMRSQGIELDQIADVLGVTPRALQWRLEQAGTTFEKVRDETRRSMAEHLLLNTDRPMIDIAHELGFSEQSAFTRAAQRWFEHPPKTYRRMSRRAAGGHSEGGGEAQD